MLAPESSNRIENNAKNIWLICAFCASSFQNLCFDPSLTIPESRKWVFLLRGGGVGEMLVPELSNRVKNGARKCLISVFCASRFQNLCYYSSFAIPKTSWGGGPIWKKSKWCDYVENTNLVVLKFIIINWKRSSTVLIRTRTILLTKSNISFICLWQNKRKRDETESCVA